LNQSINITFLKGLFMNVSATHQLYGSASQVNVDVKSLYSQGMALLKTGKNQAALNCFQEAAQSGHVESQFELGKLLIIDEAVRNLEVGIAWLKQAATTGGSKEAALYLIALDSHMGGQAVFGGESAIGLDPTLIQQFKESNAQIKESNAQKNSTTHSSSSRCCELF
jgi:TPR repeat protein